MDRGGTSARRDEHIYVAECFRVGVTEGDLPEIGARIDRAVGELTSEGRRVIHLGSLLMSEDEVVLVQFEASSAQDAAEAMSRAGITFERVVESVTRPRAGQEGV
jgi:hypothetical protein